MRYDFDQPQRGVRECPKCRFTMEYLRHSSLLDRRSGYMLDSSAGWDPDDHGFTASLVGSLIRFFWRQVIEPFGSKLIGDFWNRRYRKIARVYPESLICPHCFYILKRK